MSKDKYIEEQVLSTLNQLQLAKSSQEQAEILAELSIKSMDYQKRLSRNLFKK